MHSHSNSHSNFHESHECKIHDITVEDLIMTLKQRFIDAVVKGQLGTVEEKGVVVTLKQFKLYFSDVKTDYINSFLPASTIEPGQKTASQTRFVFRIRNGVYLVHTDVLTACCESD